MVRTLITRCTPPSRHTRTRAHPRPATPSHLNLNGGSQQLNFGVTFPIMEKVDVNGPNASPVYQYLKSQKSQVCPPLRACVRACVRVRVRCISGNCRRA